MLTTPRMFLSMIVLIVSGLAAQAETNYQTIVENGLKFLNGAGAKLEKGSSCVNCHHAPLRSWGIHEITRLKWAGDLKTYNTETEKQLNLIPKLAKAYQSKQWGHSLSAFYLVGLNQGELTKDRRETFEKLLQILLDEQTQDGSWKAAGQFKSQRRPGNDADEAQTLWSVLALSSQEVGKVRVAARDRALKWLATTTPGTTIDVRVLRLLVEVRFGDSKQAELLLTQFLETQQKDGGWGWQPTDQSDAWATGLSLYVLSELRKQPELRERVSKPIARAREFLAGSQKKDGSWFVEKKLKTAKDSGISSYFGTAWAIIGITRSQPDAALQ